MKVLVTGSRKWRDLEAVKFILQELKPTILVHGRARGADACAHFAAEDIGGIEVRPYPADWVKYGMAAGPIRNQEMLDCEHQKREPIDICIAFPQRDSVGTWDMVSRCLDVGIKVELCSEDPPSVKRFEMMKAKHKKK
jgi:hypothetical protein